MHGMKALASSLLLGSLLLGCQNTSSKLAEGGGASSSSSGSDLEARVKKLEADNAKYKDDLEWLHTQLEHQKDQEKQQQAARAASEPDPNAVFAVDIVPDLKLGQVDGPPTACVTLVEAWDFA